MKAHAASTAQSREAYIESLRRAYQRGTLRPQMSVDNALPDAFLNAVLPTVFRSHPREGSYS
ncbi:MAG: hypothetical protein AAFV53_19980 [Myxococcota bacterium]